MHGGEHAVSGLKRAARQESGVRIGVEDDQIIVAAIAFDRLQEMLLDAREGDSVRRESIFRNLELAGNQVEPSAGAAIAHEVMNQLLFRNRCEGIGRQGEPGLAGAGRIPRMDARFLEE